MKKLITNLSFWTLLGRGVILNFRANPPLICKSVVLRKERCFLIYLCGWILFLCLYTRVRNIKKNFFVVLVFRLVMLTIISFIVRRLIVFFIFFELSLIPIRLLVIVWGSQPERIKASVYILFYTILGSLPLLACILSSSIDRGGGGYLWYEIFTKKYSVRDNLLIVVFFRAAFLIKVPIFGVHNWLAKAHVEAPVVGSMLLARILLKLGGYGLFRVRFILKGFFGLRSIFFLWVVLSRVIVSILCFRNTDFKRLIAYSSVVHMSLSVVRLGICRGIRVWGAFLLFVAHGICSSGLFMFVNEFYTKRGSRKLINNQGIIFLSGVVVLNWLLLCLLKSSIPPSIKFFREIFSIMRVFQFRSMNIGLIIAAIFLKGLFKIYLYIVFRQGKWATKSKAWRTVRNRGILIGAVHVGASIFLILVLNSIG